MNIPIGPHGVEVNVVREEVSVDHSAKESESQGYIVRDANARPAWLQGAKEATRRPQRVP